VGDGIHRITIETARSIPPDAAYAEALQLGDDFVKESSPIFEEFSDQTEFILLKCSDIQQWPEYADYSRRLRDYYDADATFRQSMEGFGRNYHRKTFEGLTASEQETRVNRSCDYFLEEFAVFCCLKQTGFPVMVYPGSFSTLTEVRGPVRMVRLLPARLQCGVPQTPLPAVRMPTSRSMTPRRAARTPSGDEGGRAAADRAVESMTLANCTHASPPPRGRHPGLAGRPRLSSAGPASGQ
jgi:tRNA-dependent cyclodipeptide synthase